ADAFIALLDTGRLAVDFDLEPDAADAGRLPREPAGFAGDAGIRLVAANDRIQGPMPAHFLIDHNVEQDVALGLHPRREKAFHRHDVARHSAPPVRRAAPLYAALSGC